MAGGATKHVIQNQLALRGLALFNVLLVLWISAIYTTRSTSRNLSGWGSSADDSCPCLRKQSQYSHFNSINSTKDLFSDQNIARRSHLSGDDSPLEEEITRSEGEIGSMPIHMIQMGHPRTATTLQHAIICAALFLKLHDDPKRKHEPLLKDMVCNRFGRPFLRFEAGRPDVRKTHRFGDADLEKHITESNKNSTWLFATAKTRHQAQQWKTRLQSSGYQIKYVQDLETVRESGLQIVRKYIPIFGLNEDQTLLLMEYIRYWDTLRICCGVQMSKKWREELISRNKANTNKTLRISDIHSPSYHACSMYNIDEVERLFMETPLYRMLEQYPMVSARNRPSFQDGKLFGSYCSQYNDAVAKDGLGFNQRPRGDHDTN